MQKHKSGACKCAKCDARELGLTEDEIKAAETEWVKSALDKYGFYVHFVSEDDSSPTGFNTHTHGLQSFDDHLDFQIVFPLPANVAHGVISNIAKRVKEGERFLSGQYVSEVVGGGLDVKLIEALESDRKVLRIILPDSNGNLEPSEINESFSVQYKDIEGVTVTKRPWKAYKPANHDK